MKNSLLQIAVIACIATPFAAQAQINPTDPQPTCNMCTGTYIPLFELEAYTTKANARYHQHARSSRHPWRGATDGHKRPYRLDAPTFAEIVKGSTRRIYGESSPFSTSTGRAISRRRGSCRLSVWPAASAKNPVTTKTR